jgi:regulator of protease activity HflC (stomatin/prohibitin superfamily)
MSNVENEGPAKNKSFLYTVLGCGAGLAICFCLLGLLLVQKSWVFLTPDQRGVVLSALDPNGYRPEPLGPGTHWIVPFVEQVRVYSIARRTYVMAAPTATNKITGDDSIRAKTKDGRQVSASVSVVYALDPDKIIDLNITWQERYEDELVRPQARVITREVFGRYNLAEVSGSKQAEMEQVIFKRLGQVFGKNDLILLKFSVDKVVFQ